jgi:parvulin-like peptidyl-prolyl isomerase
MSFRSRPVLDRKHRPRWQDELRTQQLTVVGFAVAIALAIGIFGAAAWNGYWEAHFRPVAAVGDVSYDRADLAEREQMITLEAVAELTELQDQLTGGPRDQLLQQQIDSLSSQVSNVTTAAAQSLLDVAILSERAADFGLSVTEEEVDAELAERFRVPERIRANLIVIDALPDDAEPDDEPTDEQREAAMDEAQAAIDRIEGGEAFSAVAGDVSDDFTGPSGGGLGWFADGDVSYDEYFDALADAEADEIVGPIEVDEGAAVVQLVERREATSEGPLAIFLRAQGIDLERYRDYVRDDLLEEAFREHFDAEVVVSPAPQRRVAQIVIAGVTEAVGPELRARHVLIAPDPSLDDQAEATDEQWAAALEEAEEVHAQLEAEDADWFEIAEEHSDDPGSGARGGDLGWSEVASSPYVPEFTAALEELEVGDLSEPVRSPFGYHVIQKVGERESPEAGAAELLEQLQADPDSFAEVAERLSEDATTAREGGELGWVARYQLDRINEDAVFALTEVGEISPIVEDSAGTMVIYQLLETSESEPIDEERLDQIRGSGFERWLDEEVRAGVESWLDPQYATSAASA